jgi:hypothetical protein
VIGNLPMDWVAGIRGIRTSGTECSKSCVMQPEKAKVEFSSHYNSPSVPQGLEGGRSAVPCRHGQKGGYWPGGGCGSYGCGIFRQRRDYRGHVSLRDTEPLRQSSQGAGRSITKDAERRQQRGQQQQL